MAQPPTPMESAENPIHSPERIAALRLAMISGVGPRIRCALLERFGSPEAVLRAAPSKLREVPGVGPKLTNRIAAATEEVDAEGEMQRCCRAGVAILLETDEAYPRLLRKIVDPPGVLFVRGELKRQDALAVGIVGTRHASQYGLRQAERLAGGLARAGLTVISGLARGIDAAAHRGALAAGGRTIAALASGVSNIYPPEHVGLADQVAEVGALLSESPPTAQPLGGAFPQRNRIISGMSLGVLVVEAAHRSGALITARHAMEQNREVFAVPGRVDQRTSHGCHRLIRDGAVLVETVDDVLDALGPLFEAAPRDDGRMVHHPAELQLNDLEQKVLDAIAVDGTSIDQIVSVTAMPVARVLSTVSVLEMRRLVRRLSGTTVARS